MDGLAASGGGILGGGGGVGEGQQGGGQGGGWAGRAHRGETDHGREGPRVRTGGLLSCEQRRHLGYILEDEDPDACADCRRPGTHEARLLGVAEAEP